MQTRVGNRASPERTVPVAARDPSDRALVARIAASERWAHTHDRNAATAPARDARWQRYLDRVDPEGILDPAERARAAEHLRRADMSRLALRSAQARRARSRATQLEAEVAAALAEQDDEAVPAA